LKRLQIKSSRINLKRKLTDETEQHQQQQHEPLSKKLNLDKQDLKKSLNLNLDEEDWDTEASVNVNNNHESFYQTCLIGSSMVKHIDVKLLFPDKNCLFKSISGGRINDIINYLKANEKLLINSKCFVVTCGSNDCDSLSELKDVVSHYFELAQYLKNTFNKASFVFNKLIPRTKCRYVSILEFEKRRICFNNFLEYTLPLIVPCQIVEHLAFDSKTELSNLLLDGVHISPLRGLPLYIEQIKKALQNINS